MYKELNLVIWWTTLNTADRLINLIIIYMIKCTYIYFCVDFAILVIIVIAIVKIKLNTNSIISGAIIPNTVAIRYVLVRFIGSVDWLETHEVTDPKLPRVILQELLMKYCVCSITKTDLV